MLGRVGLLAAIVALGAAPIVWARGGAHQGSGASQGARGGTRHATHTVARPAPEIVIGSPANGAAYVHGQVLAANYSCSSPDAEVVTRCAGTVANGSPIPTRAIGTHRFTVSASTSAGAHAKRTVVYIVLAGAPASAPAPAPVLSTLTQSAATWREGHELPHASRARPSVGTTFSFTLNEPAAVTFAFSALAARGGSSQRCAAHGARGARGRCAQAVTRASFSFPADEGTNRLVFEGRPGAGELLAAGAYEVEVTARDAAGRSTTPQSLRFAIAG
jgi:hypothetical protein